MGRLNLEIWFPQQTEVSVSLESSITDPEEEQASEVSLFALYAARQIVNLRHDGYALATVLAATDAADPLRQAEQRVGELRFSSPRLLDGRKGFTVEFRPGARVFFKFNAHGFGLLGKGIGYYSPTSTIALLHWLLNRRKDSAAYLRALATAAEKIGRAGDHGLVSVTSQAVTAMQVAREAWAESMTAGRRDDAHGSDDRDANAAALSWEDVLSNVRADLDQLLIDVPADEKPGYRALVLEMPICGFHVLAAAGLGEDERLIRSLAAVEEASDEGSQQRANGEAARVIEDLLEEHDLSRVASAVYLAIATEATESFDRRGR